MRVVHGQAPPPRPSSNDCPASAVDSQAGMLEKTTGAEGPGEKVLQYFSSGVQTRDSRLSIAFRKKLEKPRLRLRDEVDECAQSYSAPTSPNIGVLDLTWDEISATSTKRGRRDSLNKADVSGVKDGLETSALSRGEAKLATTIRKNLKKIESITRNLANLATERNTRREIKEAAASLRSLVSQISTNEAQELLQTLGCSTPATAITAQNKVDAATQTEIKNNGRGEVEKRIEGVGCYEDFLEIVNCK